MYWQGSRKAMHRLERTDQDESSVRKLAVIVVGVTNLAVRLVGGLDIVGAVERLNQNGIHRSWRVRLLSVEDPLGCVSGSRRLF